MQELPPWVQVLASLATFVVAAWVYFSGTFKKITTPTVSRDVMVQSVTIADGQAIRNLADELRDVNRAAGDRQELFGRLNWQLERLNDQVEEIRHMMIEHSKGRGG